MLLLWWCPLKLKKEKRAGLQFTSTDYLSLVLTPLSSCLTIPLTSFNIFFLLNKFFLFLCGYVVLLLLPALLPVFPYHYGTCSLHRQEPPLGLWPKADSPRNRLSGVILWWVHIFVFPSKVLIFLPKTIPKFQHNLHILSFIFPTITVVRFFCQHIFLIHE